MVIRMHYYCNKILLVKQKVYPEFCGGISKFYANKVNSWLVIQNFRGPCKIQAHGAILL